MLELRWIFDEEKNYQNLFSGKNPSESRNLYLLTLKSRNRRSTFRIIFRQQKRQLSTPIPTLQPSRIPICLVSRFVTRISAPHQHFLHWTIDIMRVQILAQMVPEFQDRIGQLFKAR